MEKVIVFDLDDTLYKEIDYLKSAYSEIASFIECECNKNGIYDFMISSYGAGRNAFEEIVVECNSKVSVDQLIQIYRVHKPNICLNSDVLFVLETLSQQKNIALGLLTDGRSITQRNKICALGLNSYFKDDNCIVSEELGFSKPSFEGYLFFQQKYEGADYYYIGDNLNKDFIAPSQMGWTCICLLDNGFNIHKQDLSLIQNYQSLHCVNNLKNIIPYL